MNLTQLASDYQRIEKAIQFIEENFSTQPSLHDIAESANLSEFHFQRLFSRWVGISPKRFLQFITKEYAKELLGKRQNMLDVTYETGLSSPGRLHDLFVSCEAVTPGEFKTSGEGLKIDYGIHSSPFGQCLLAVTDRGICGLHFIREDGSASAVDNLRKTWGQARITENPSRTESWVERVFNPQRDRDAHPLHLVFKGTNFQIKVWEALLTIPEGSVATYEDMAVAIGNPRAVRAVGTAVGDNPISYIVPCHRVIRKSGDFGNYGGGRARKKAILGWEAAKIHLLASRSGHVSETAGEFR